MKSKDEYHLSDIARYANVNGVKNKLLVRVSEWDAKKIP